MAFGKADRTAVTPQSTQYTPLRHGLPRLLWPPLSPIGMLFQTVPHSPASHQPGFHWPGHRFSGGIIRWRAGRPRKTGRVG